MANLITPYRDLMTERTFPLALMKEFDFKAINNNNFFSPSLRLNLWAFFNNIPFISLSKYPRHEWT